MTTYYDEQGNAVEAFSKEELEAQLAAKLEEQQTTQAPAPESQDMSPVLARLQKTENDLYQMRVEKYADIHAGNDAEKREKFMAKFGRLTGYEETPDGIAERARDAAKLAFDDAQAAASTADLANAGGRNVNVAPQGAAPANDAEAQLRKELGISDDDVEKYSKKD